MDYKLEYLTLEPLPPLKSEEKHGTLSSLNMNFYYSSCTVKLYNERFETYYLGHLW
jgi:hypothetical protein